MSLLDIPSPLWLHIQSHLHWQDRLAHTVQLSHLLPARCVWTAWDHVRLSDAMWEALLDESRSALQRLCSASSLDIGAHSSDVELVAALLEGSTSPLSALLERLQGAVEQPFTLLHTLLCSDIVLRCMLDSGIHLPKLHSLSLWPQQSPRAAVVCSLLYTHRRRLPALQRLKLHRFSLHTDDHRQLLSLPDLQLLDISRCSWSAVEGVTPTVLSLPAHLTRLLLDTGPARSLPLMDGLLDTALSSSAGEHLTSLSLRANLLSTSLHLLSALHNLVSLDLASSQLPDESYLAYFVSASFTPLLPGLLRFDASECSYGAVVHRPSVAAFVSFIDCYPRLRHFGFLLTEQMAAAGLVDAVLRVLSEARTLELPCLPQSGRSRRSRYYDDDDDADDEGGSDDDEGYRLLGVGSSALPAAVMSPLLFLRMLSLRDSLLTDAALLNVVTTCPALTHLVLQNSQELTTASFLVLAQYAPQLRVLHLSGANVKLSQGAWREAASAQPHLAHLITTPTTRSTHSHAVQSSASSIPPAAVPSSSAPSFPVLEQLTLECPYTSQMDSAGLTTLVAMLRTSPLHTISIELPAEDSAAFYLLHLAPLRHLRCLDVASTWNSSGMHRKRANSVVQLLQQYTKARPLDRVQWERCVAGEWNDGMVGDGGSGGSEVEEEEVQEGEGTLYCSMGVESAHVSGLERVFTCASDRSADGREGFFQRLRDLCAR